MSERCFEDLRKEGLELVKTINSIDQAQFEKRLARLFAKDEIAGPLACAYVFRNMKKVCSQDVFWDQQIAACEHAARIAWKLRRGYEQYGMSPFDVVYYTVPQPLPRYSSEPTLRAGRNVQELASCKTREAFS